MEVFVSTVQASETCNVARSVQIGHSLLRFPSVVTADECSQLVRTSGKFAASLFKAVAKQTPKSRMTDAEYLLNDAKKVTEGRTRIRLDIECLPTLKPLCDRILLRVLSLLREDLQLPAILSELFGDLLAGAPESVIDNPQLGFSAGEPAINVYRSGGSFAPHQDKQSLTILVALSDAASGDFVGGGTGFWSYEDRGAHRTWTSMTSDPTVIEHAPIGTVLVFGGSLTHAGLAVQSGERTVFVASFSPCEVSTSVHDDSEYRAKRREEEKELEQKEMIRRAMRRRKAAAIKARCKAVRAAPAA